MPFLLKTDYAVQIKQDLLNTVVDAQDWLRVEAEQAAQFELEGYLRGKYDLPACFIDLQPWHQVQQYAAGAVVTDGTATVGTGALAMQVALIYVATEPSTGVQPVAPAPGAPAAGPWLSQDPRHQLLKMYLIDATLYHLHSRQNPRTVPQIRQDRYDQVISWCRDCRAGKVSPGLPLLPDKAADGTPNQESLRVRGGGNKKLNNSW